MLHASDLDLAMRSSCCLGQTCGCDRREVVCLLQSEDSQGQSQGSGQVYVHRLCRSGNAVLARPRPIRIAKEGLGTRSDIMCCASAE